MQLIVDIEKLRKAGALRRVTRLLESSDDGRRLLEEGERLRRILEDAIANHIEKYLRLPRACFTPAADPAADGR